MTIDPMLLFVDELLFRVQNSSSPKFQQLQGMLRVVIVMMITAITANDHHHHLDHFEKEKKPMPEWQ